jgi:pSer/pThr/pTyr-binding forkhead associated (FHA) protein
MTRRFVVVAGPDQGRAFEVPEADALLLGRSKATQTRLTDPHVSRVHCEVEVKGGRVSVHDFDSAGGTFVNGRRVEREDLRAGDVVRIGETELRFEDDVPEQPTLPPPAPAPEIVFAAKRGAKPLPASLQRLQALVGQSLGRYQLQEVLGAGQVGLVFRARDTSTQTPVALKVFKPEFASDAKGMKRLVRGLMAARSLTHPNLVTLHAAGKTDPYWWIAMELVEGESLAQAIERGGKPEGRDWRKTLRVAVHVCHALDFAHQRALIHRNVMPPNILIRAADGVAKLGDLVLAKELEGALGTQVSQPGEMVGNVFYMSPERTQSTPTVDGRSDLYSLGVTVYQALAGRLPFTATTLVEVVRQIRQGQPAGPRQFLPSLPAPFEGMVLKTLAKRPEDRYPTAAALLADLEALARAEGVPV